MNRARGAKAALALLGVTSGDSGRGRRYDRASLMALWSVLTESAGVGAIQFPSPAFYDAVASHLDVAASDLDRLASSNIPHSAFDNEKTILLKEPTPLTPDKALNVFRKLTGQKPRSAWEYLRHAGAKNLPPRPR